jgi:endonuclease/exonuclease/phosphatase family metal-dependent hydrolase
MKLLQEAISLSIVLWNVWLLPAPISSLPRERAQCISPLLAGHDLVVLNEAFTYKDTLRKAAGYPFSATLGGKSLWPWRFRPVDSGLMILSQYPFEKIAKEMYDARGGVDKYAAKGILMVRINVDGEEVDIYATHMQSQPSSKQEIIREKQVVQLANFINFHSGSGTLGSDHGDNATAVQSTEHFGRKVIVAGDMNMGPLTNIALYDWCYQNEEDKISRTRAYTHFKELASLVDAKYENSYWQQDINRFLVRNVGGIVKNIRKPTAMIKGKDTELSDSERYVFEAVINRS